MDEPSEELDHSGRIQIMDLVKKLSDEQKTIMLISHDSDFLFEVCSYLSIWIDGKVETYLKTDLFENAEIFAKAGIDIPYVIQVAQKADMVDEFRKKGVSSLRNMELEGHDLTDSARSTSGRDA
jgi:ABC-type multidrug transport system ATPase subunit